MHCDTSGYRSALPTHQLIATLRALLDEQRIGQRLLCRYLADLSDRVASRGADALGGYSDVYHAARVLLGIGVRRTRECVRVGKALRALPAVDRAFVEGRLCWSRVREITRVARPDDEVWWIALARELPMRVLERRVAEAGGTHAHDDRTADPARISWTSPDTIDVHLTLRAETWALLQRVMEGARRATEGDALLSDADAIAAVARDALAQQTASETNEVRRAVVLYECRTCLRTEIETGAGPIEIGDAAAAALACGAPVRDLRLEGRIERRGGPLPTSVARAVRLRDRDRCRVPGCSRRRYVDVHHIDARARGGVHSRENCLCLCDTHHRLLHEQKLFIQGDAEGALEFLDASRNPILDPLAPIAVTQGGSSLEQQPGPASDSASDAARLLSTMGERGGWDADALCEATGLSAAAVGATLLTFEIARCVRRDAAGRYAVSPTALAAIS